MSTRIGTKLRGNAKPVQRTVRRAIAILIPGYLDRGPVRTRLRNKITPRR